MEKLGTVTFEQVSKLNGKSYTVVADIFPPEAGYETLFMSSDMVKPTNKNYKIAMIHTENLKAHGIKPLYAIIGLKSKVIYVQEYLLTNSGKLKFPDDEDGFKITKLEIDSNVVEEAKKSKIVRTMVVVDTSKNKIAVVLDVSPDDGVVRLDTDGVTDVDDVRPITKKDYADQKLGLVASTLKRIKEMGSSREIAEAIKNGDLAPRAGTDVVEEGNHTSIVLKMKKKDDFTINIRDGKKVVAKVQKIKDGYATLSKNFDDLEGVKKYVAQYVLNTNNAFEDRVSQVEIQDLDKGTSKAYLVEEESLTISPKEVKKFIKEYGLDANKLLIAMQSPKSRGTVQRKVRLAIDGDEKAIAGLSKEYSTKKRKAYIEGGAVEETITTDKIGTLTYNRITPSGKAIATSVEVYLPQANYQDYFKKSDSISPKHKAYKVVQVLGDKQRASNDNPLYAIIDIKNKIIWVQLDELDKNKKLQFPSDEDGYDITSLKLDSIVEEAVSLMTRDQAREARQDGAYDDKTAGCFGWKYAGKMHDGVLLLLSNYDKKLISSYPLKANEVIFRYETENVKISGSKPLIKINTEKGLIYFLTEKANEEDIVEFESKGNPTVYINLWDETDHTADADGNSGIEAYMDSLDELDTQGLQPFYRFVVAIVMEHSNNSTTNFVKKPMAQTTQEDYFIKLIFRENKDVTNGKWLTKEMFYTTCSTYKAIFKLYWDCLKPEFKKDFWKKMKRTAK